MFLFRRVGVCVHIHPGPRGNTLKPGDPDVGVVAHINYFSKYFSAIRKRWLPRGISPTFFFFFLRNYGIYQPPDNLPNHPVAMIQD